MRLICPNCGAQYAVDGSIIPDGGRDVQCSNCGHTWFQMPEGEEAAPPPGFDPEPGPETEPEAEASPEPAPKPAPQETTRITPQPDATPKPDLEPEPAPVPPQRRALDSAVMDVLREEAEREKAARAAEARPAPEPSPEPEASPEPEPNAAPTPEAAAEGADDLPEPDERVVASESHKARMRGEHPAAAVAALSGRAAHRSEMLPDIEEINSTLRASADPSRSAEQPGAVVEEQRKKRGFRMGFGLMVVIFLGLALLYLHGPKVARAVPALETSITSYINSVNAGRLWLDDLLRGASSRQ
ncbi:zinc-ribbon domain-containing protein [Vannielia sp.]|uniref:zinc-ribbon domain-containing protein n=1 Tax=Vannielia sp. TaxID=2813045 RepID=UPI00261CD931|nr:zinc-ribbon domain-containing protein [Vannielia sp.]MDF1873705.1 zinc-ribbon domain-containing protein [Vannielia sp.]